MSTHPQRFRPLEGYTSFGRPSGAPSFVRASAFKEESTEEIAVNAEARRSRGILVVDDNMEPLPELGPAPPHGAVFLTTAHR